MNFLLRLLPLLVLFSVSANASPRIGIEREVSPPLFGPVQSNRQPIDVSYNGSEGFILWSEAHSGFFLGTMRGSRIDATGRLLDPAGIQISDETSSIFAGSIGAVRWVRDAWLVVWPGPRGLSARRISRSGVALGEAVPLRRGASAMDHAIGMYSHPLIETNGTTALITSFTHTAYLVSADLSRIEEIDLSPVQGRHLAFDGTHYVVFGFVAVSHISHRPTAVRIASDGTTTRHDLPWADPFAVAWTGRDYLLVSRVGGQLMGVRLSADLTTRGPSSFHIAPADGWAVAWGAYFIVIPGDAAGEAVVVWKTTRGSNAVTISAGDEVGPIRHLAEWPVDHNHALAQSPTGFILYGPDLTATLFTPDLDPISVGKAMAAIGYVGQRLISAVRDGTPAPIVFAQFGANGSRIAIAPRVGAPARTLFDNDHEQGFPAIGSSGRRSLVAWLEAAPEESAFGYRLMILPTDQSGRPLADTPIRLGSASAAPIDRWFGSAIGIWPGPPAVLWTGELFLVAWIADARVRYAAIDEEGNIVREAHQPFPSIRPSNGQRVPVLARLGDVALLVWSEGRTAPCGIVCSDGPGILRAVRLTSSGELLDDEPRTISSEPFSVFGDVAVSGETALIVWEQQGEIFGRRLTSSGRFLDAVPIRISDRGYFPATRPKVARHGFDFVVTWLVGEPDRSDMFEHEVRAASVSSAGVVGPAFSVATGTYQTEGPFAWTTESGYAAIAYLRYNTNTNGVPKLFFRLVENSSSSRVRAVRR